MTAEEAAWASVPFNYGPRCRREHERPHRRGHPAPARAPVPRAGLPRADVRRRAAQLLRAADAHRGADARRPRPPRPRDPGRERRDPRRAASRTPAADPRGRRSPVPDRGARGRRGDRAVLRGGRDASDGSLDVRVADVVRAHAARAPATARGAPARRARAHLRGARRALEPARPGAAGARASAPGSRVAYLDRTAPEVVELLFAASKIGAVAVPLNWRLAAPELAAVVADAGAPRADRRARRSREVAAERRRAASPRRSRSSRSATDYERWLAAHEPRDPGGRGEAGDAVVQMYTSGHDRRAEGRADHAPQPRGRARRRRRAGRSTSDSVSLTPLPMFHIGGIGWAYSGSGTARPRSSSASSTPRRVLDLLERRARDQRRLRADDAADADRRAGRRRARLLRAALDRLRRLADHHAGAQGGAAHVPLPAVRRLRADRDAPAASSSSTPRTTIPAARASTCCAPPAGRYPWVELRIVDPVSGGELRAARGRRGLAARRRTSWPATSTAPRRPPRRSRRTAGCAPATAATSTRRATCSSPTGSRT